MSNNQDFYTYWENARKYPKIRETEIRDTCRKGIDKSAFDNVIMRNQQYLCWLIHSKWKYSAGKYGIPLIDLLGAANIGLIKGTRKYDPNKGTFLSYITLYVKSYLQQHFFQQIGCSRIEGKKRLKLHQNPSIFDSMSFVIADNGEDGPLTLEDVIADPKDNQIEVIMDVENLLCHIKHKPKKNPNLPSEILQLHYGIGKYRNNGPKSIAKIASNPKFNLSKETIRKLESRVCDHLRSIIR